MERRHHRKRYEHAGDGRYLTFSCYRGLPLFANDRIKDALAVQLEERRKRDGFQLIAWVIMPEHVHLLIIPPAGQTASKVLQGIKQPFAQRTLARWRKLDAPILARLLDTRGETRFWQRGGGYDRNIVSESELIEKIAYIHANPVRRGLVSVETAWVWSSANWYIGDRSGPVQIDPFKA